MYDRAGIEAWIQRWKNDERGECKKNTALVERLLKEVAANQKAKKVNGVGGVKVCDLTTSMGFSAMTDYSNKSDIINRADTPPRLLFHRPHRATKSATRTAE